MNNQEVAIISELASELEQGDLVTDPELDQLIFYLRGTPLNQISPDFLTDQHIVELIKHIPQYPPIEGPYALLCLLMSRYLNRVGTLVELEQGIQTVFRMRQNTPETRARGMAYLPYEFANPNFLKKVYETGDESLIKLFFKYFPRPGSAVFAEDPVPASVSQAELESTQAVKGFLERNNKDLERVNKVILALQRQLRGKKRGNEDLHRLTWFYGDNEDVNMMLDEANRPYQPQCDPQLAARLIKAAEQVTLFHEVSHMTAPTALKSIMNDGLFGRKTLMDFYMPYRPASLADFDIKQGDLNVVCLGAFRIDSSATQLGAQLVFDAKKISQDNPCVFFKQRDLGYNLINCERKVQIGDLNISFTHTERYDDKQVEQLKTQFLLIKPGDEDKNIRYRDIYGVGAVPNALLISRNIEQMHQILTLNFFRYLDSLEIIKPNTGCPGKEEIYAALSKLNDEELKLKLEEIGQKCCDTMEFNFYGVYQIDFSALKKVSQRNPAYSLDLHEFIAELNQGDLTRFHEGLEKLPTLFQSYRFMDYIIAQVTNKEILPLLQAQREQCTVPAFLRPQ